MKSKAQPQPTNESESERAHREPDIDENGVDLAQIRALLALTPMERAEALKRAANNLLRARRLARRN